MSRARAFVVATLLFLLAMSPADSAHLLSTTYHVSLNTYDDSWLTSICSALISSPTYSPLMATATSQGADEYFNIRDLNDGDLVDGDVVLITCDGQGSHDFSGLAPWSGETPIRFSEPTPGGVTPPADRWYLWDTDCGTSGCTVQNGHKLNFQNYYTGKYLYAVNGGGGNVNADATSATSYARFEIIF
jgi:hypothetical protein